MIGGLASVRRIWAGVIVAGGLAVFGTGALLIAEVANYDFGIGDSQELFEALIVYSRVLSGYLDSIYKHNVAVAELEKLTSIAVNKMKNPSR